MENISQYWIAYGTYKILDYIPNEATSGFLLRIGFNFWNMHLIGVKQ